jgi:hypothetical protein
MHGPPLLLLVTLLETSRVRYQACRPLGIHGHGDAPRTWQSSTECRPVQMSICNVKIKRVTGESCFLYELDMGEGVARASTLDFPASLPSYSPPIWRVVVFRVRFLAVAPRGWVWRYLFSTTFWHSHG